MDTAVEKFAHFYGRLVVEDFMEIFLVAVNGYGYAAQKLLRSIYEHAVTLEYLNDHPEEIDNFIDYDAVQQYKMMQPILETFGTNALPPNTVADVKSKYEEMKEPKPPIKFCHICKLLCVCSVWETVKIFSSGLFIVEGTKKK